MTKLDAKSLISGLLTGIAIGSITLLLTTPQSGRSTRNLIKKKKNTWFSSRKSELKLPYPIEGPETLDGMTRKVQKTLKRYKQEVEPEMVKIEQQAQEIADAIALLNKQIRKSDN